MVTMKYVLCLFILALAVASSVSAGRHRDLEWKGSRDSEWKGNKFLRHRLQHHVHAVKREAGLYDRGLRALCIPATVQLLEEHEGRHECAYDHPNGFRAVGVAYNLDDDVEARRSELATLFADYDKVYKGEACLYNIQITTLLALDAKRALDKAAKSVEPLDDFCCSMQAVFADVQYSVDASSSFPEKDMKSFIEKASLKEWRSAAHELKETDWCYNNRERCDDNINTVNSGCNTVFTV